MLSVLVALQRRLVGSPWAVKDTLWPQQGDCFRQEGNCQSLECLVQTLDLVLTGVWRGEGRQEEKQCFQSVTGLSSSSKAPSVVGVPGAGERFGRINPAGCVDGLQRGDQQQGWSCTFLDVLCHLKPEEMTELPPSLPRAPWEPLQAFPELRETSPVVEELVSHLSKLWAPPLLPVLPRPPNLSSSGPNLLK